MYVSRTDSHPLTTKWGKGRAALNDPFFAVRFTGFIIGKRMSNAGRKGLSILCALVALSASLCLAQTPPPAPPTVSPSKAEVPIEFPEGDLAPFEKHPIFIKVLIKAKNEKELARLKRHRTPYEKWALLGGKHLPNTDLAFRFDLGWPSLDISVHYPITSTIELIPKATFFYGFPVVNSDQDACCGVGNALGTQVRFFLWEQRGFYLSLLTEASLLLNYNMDSAPGFHAGARVGVGLKMSFDAAPTMDLIGGIMIPLDVYFSNPLALFAPIQMMGGIEYSLTKKWLIFFKVEVVPGFTALIGNSNDFAFGMTGRMGVAYRFVR